MNKNLFNGCWLWLHWDCLHAEVTNVLPQAAVILLSGWQLI